MLTLLLRTLHTYWPLSDSSKKLKDRVALSGDRLILDSNARGAPSLSQVIMASGEAPSHVKRKKRPTLGCWLSTDWSVDGFTEMGSATVQKTITILLMSLLYEMCSAVMNLSLWKYLKKVWMLWDAGWTYLSLWLI